MPGSIWPRSVSVLVFGLLLTIGSLPASAQIRFDLPSQPLANALTAVGSQANLNIYFDASTVDGILAPALKAELNADNALARLLAGTRLRAIRVDDNTFRVVIDAGGNASQTTHGTNTGSVRAPAVHLAYAGGNAGVSPESSANQQTLADDSTHSASNMRNLEEVVVTAEKRSERLQDVPVPVTAISAASLVESNELRIQDYYAKVPGLNLATDQFSGAPILSIRGVTTGSGNNPTVGVTVDDVPFGSSTALGEGDVAPDIDPSELARVEVLRGPQGTLYGTSSMGGLLKYVTIDPTTDRFFGSVQAGIDGIHNGDGTGYSLRASVNIPLTDTWAMRASGFTRVDPGYVNDANLGVEGVNRIRSGGARLSTLWRPSEAHSLKVSALIQDTRRNGSDLVNVGPGFGDLQQSALPGTGGDHRKLQAYSATLKMKLSDLELTALTGYNSSSVTYPIDLTSAYSSYTQPQFGTPGTKEVPDNRAEKFSQEIRLSAPIGEKFESLLGLFYTYENAHNNADIFAADTLTGATTGLALDSLTPSTYAEYAGFADLTYHFTDRFDVQLGGRRSEIRQTQGQYYAGPFNISLLGLPSSPFDYPKGYEKGSSFTYLLTPRLKLSPDLMIYARIASGYRAGGINLNPQPVSTVSPTFKPDTTRNYEIGVKGDILDHLLSFDSSIYYIDWKDIQVTVLDPNFIGYYANAGKAKSQGIELSLEAKPLTGMTISAWGAWDDAELRQVPSNSFVAAAPGDPLPYTSRFSGNLSVDQEFPIVNDVTGYFGASASYVGARRGGFENIFVAPERQTFPSYTQANVQAGARFSKSWTVNLFVTNLADRRGILTGGLGTFNPATFDYIRPRTYGLSVTRAF